MFALAFMLPASMSAQSFSVLVLDALDGRPQPSVIVNYFCEGEGYIPSNYKETDDSGIAVVPFICKTGGSVELNVQSKSNQMYAKEECGELIPLTLQSILSKGAISDPSGAGNIWCPRKVSKKLKPVPGEVIIFMKRPTWWQVHVAG